MNKQMADLLNKISLKSGGKKKRRVLEEIEKIQPRPLAGSEKRIPTPPGKKKK